jgi:hypothetical protein
MKKKNSRLSKTLCVLSVSSVSLWLAALSTRFTTETQRTQRLHRNRTRLCCYLGALAFSLALVFAFTNISSGQKRPLRRTVTPKPAAIDYSKFSHNTKKHQGACNTCHKIPSSDWKKVSTYPDIIDYPDHEACVSCHRPQFFKGARPLICSNCHVKTSPRDVARFPFRNPSSRFQFNIEFPHDKHQDVIALLRTAATPKTAFAHPRINRDVQDQTYNNCAICHVQSSSVPKAPAAGWPDAFEPKLATFKRSPAGHDSCFACHWKSQQPIAQNCVGCHKLTEPYSADLAPVRISLKFMHEGGGEKKVHVAECSTCHINITKSASLRGLKPDVPITSCTECHNRAGLRQDVSNELANIDKNRAFNCMYCHTSDVGKLDPPASHYLIAERPPLKRSEIK